jgi:hypothetical protein
MKIIQFVPTDPSSHIHDFAPSSFHNAEINHKSGHDYRKILDTF